MQFFKSKFKEKFDETLKAIFLVVAILRMLFGIPLSRLLVLFYMAIFILAAFVPADLLAIAFDSGGVTTGPMTATFLLPLAMGACEASGGNIITDAFGIVAMVAMTPLITIQTMGLIFKIKENKMHKSAVYQESHTSMNVYGDMEIIEL